MLIGIDGSEANVEKRVGINTYAFEILWALYNLDKNDNEYVIFLRNSPREELPPERENWKYKILPGSGVWLIKNLMPHLFLTKKRPDIFFEPSHYVPPLAPMPMVCSIMDLGYLKFSAQLKFYDYWQLTLWSAYSMLVAKCIFAISSSTKQEIVKHYPFFKNKIVITPLAYDDKKFTPHLSETKIKQVMGKYGISSDYVLFLSTLKPSKNIEGLIDAWKKVKDNFGQSSQVKLVIAGKKGWMYDKIFARVRENKLESSIIFTDFVDEEDKPYLISAAKLFVLPSFWEGFGLDVLNAFGCGIPVVASNVGSLPEVVDDAGLLVDPNNIDSISDAIIKVLSMDKKEYNILVQKGIAQAKKFSWEETAKKTLESFKNVIQR